MKKIQLMLARFQLIKAITSFKMRKKIVLLLTTLLLVPQWHAHAADWDSPVLIRSTLGQYSNIWEILVQVDGQLCHYYKEGNEDGRNPDVNWIEGQCFGNNITSAPGFIQSNFGTDDGGKGNFEVVVVEDSNKLCHYYRSHKHYPDKVGKFQQSECFETTNNSFPTAPALIQSTFGTRGSFEVVVQLDDQFCHYYRINDRRKGVDGFRWDKSECKGDNITSAPALIQSTFGTGDIKNFEVVVQQGDKLSHWFRDNDMQGFPWYEREDEFVTSNPINIDEAGVTLIQQDIDVNGSTQRDFIVAGVQNGKLCTWKRNNEIDKEDWKFRCEFPDHELERISGRPALLGNKIGNENGLELIIFRKNPDLPLQHYSTISRRDEQTYSMFNEGALRALEFVVPPAESPLAGMNVFCARATSSQSNDPEFPDEFFFACNLATGVIPQFYWTTRSSSKPDGEALITVKGNARTANVNGILNESVRLGAPTRHTLTVNTVYGRRSCEIIVNHPDVQCNF
jgi:hypothetical protein